MTSRMNQSPEKHELDALLLELAAPPPVPAPVPRSTPTVPTVRLASPPQAPAVIVAKAPRAPPAKQSPVARGAVPPAAPEQAPASVAAPAPPAAAKADDSIEARLADPWKLTLARLHEVPKEDDGATDADRVTAHFDLDACLAAPWSETLAWLSGNMPFGAAAKAAPGKGQTTVKDFLGDLGGFD